MVSLFVRRVDMSEGVDRRLVWVFMRELEVQARLALIAFDALRRLPEVVQALCPCSTDDPAIHPFQPWLRRAHSIPWISGRYYGPMSQRYDATDVAFLLAAAFLSHAAAVSRILVPPGPRNSPFTESARKARANELQNIIGLELPLLRGQHARDVRNSLEHTDERLERWSLSPAGQSLDLVDMNHFPFGLSNMSSEPPVEDRVRTIGGDAIQFRFGEDLGHMAAIAGELQQLMDRVAAWQMRDAKEPLIVPPGPGSELVPQEIYIHRREASEVFEDELMKAAEYLVAAGLIDNADSSDIESLRESVVKKGWLLRTEDVEDYCVASVARPSDAARRLGDTTVIADSWSPIAAAFFAARVMLEEDTRAWRP